MKIELNEVECRVLGCLIEKENTTPDYYPLTLNALTNACNQKSNRFPVVSYTDEWVETALDSLREKNIVYVNYTGGRVAKYKHITGKFFDIELPEIAILCVLLLRSAQTLGELNQRTSRIYAFENLDEVNQTVEGLVNRDTPLVFKLPKQSGQKAEKFAHLLSGEIDLEDLPTIAQPTSVSAKNERIENLEQKVENLETELKEFREDFVEFKKQFE